MNWFERYCLILRSVNQEKISVSIVNYTNTLPFKWALKRSALLNKIDLQEDIPSICAQKLKFGQVDLALVPVALLPELKNYKIVSQFCIGTKGKVDTVKLYSQVPFDEIQEVSLDYQSKSSNALVRVLFQFFWKKTVRYKEALPGFETTVHGTHAIVVIGDRTFSLNGQFRYEYDLAEEWQKLTGLPFVFACWVSTKTLDAAFVQQFDDCLAYGVENIASAIEEKADESPINKQNTLKYLTMRIDYNLDSTKKEAMFLFLELLKQL
jgi:chorismate dehydratase